MSLRVSVEIKDKKTLEGFKKAPRIMERRLSGAVHRVAEEIAREGKGNAPKAFSTLANSIRSDRINPFTYLVRPHISSDPSEWSYADAVEEGTEPGGWPSSQSLLDWMRVKNIQPLSGSLRDALFLIGRKINQQGTPAQPYMEPATQGKQSRLRQLIAVEAQRGLVEAGLA